MTAPSPSATGSSTKAGFGVAFGSVGKIVGFETDIAYQPEVIDNSANALAKSHVFTARTGSRSLICRRPAFRLIALISGGRAVESC